MNESRRECIVKLIQHFDASLVTFNDTLMESKTIKDSEGTGNINYVRVSVLFIHLHKVIE